MIIFQFCFITGRHPFSSCLVEPLLVLILSFFGERWLFDNGGVHWHMEPTILCVRYKVESWERKTSDCMWSVCSLQCFTVLVFMCCLTGLCTIVIRTQQHSSLLNSWQSVLIISGLSLFHQWIQRTPVPHLPHLLSIHAYSLSMASPQVWGLGRQILLLLSFVLITCEGGVCGIAGTPVVVKGVYQVEQFTQIFIQC